MNYLESVEVIKEIERKYDVMSITYKGVSIWPWIRVYLCDSLSVNKQQKMSSSNVSLVLKTLFAYNPLKAFKKNLVWTYSSQDKRKKLGDKLIAPVSGCISEICEQTLTIEWPNRERPIISKKNINEDRIVSASWILMISHAFEILFRVRKFKLEKEDLLLQILKDYNVKFDYEYFTRFLVAQRWTMNFVLALVPKPKVVFFECPCTCMGFIWSYHNHGIPVVEMQHGVLNNNHYAYCSKHRYDLFYPDRICVFGETEYNYFMKEDVPFCKNVERTGLYILEKSNEFFNRDIFSEYRKDYSHIVVVAGQTLREDEFVDFVDKAAEENKDCLFVYVPRHPNEKTVFKQDNVKYTPNVNIYEYLKWCDIHFTMFSTTCLESQYFRKGTIFFDIDGIATEYYGNVITPINGAYYIREPKDFKQAVVDLLSNPIKFRDLFEQDHKEKLARVINQYIK